MALLPTSNVSYEQPSGNGVFEKLGLGLTDTAIATGISFANTGIALANVFGADAKEIDTENAIRNTIGASGANFYSENKSVIEGAAFIAGSLVPGLMGVKGLRAAQMALKESTLLGTGLRAALIPKNTAASIGEFISAKGTVDGQLMLQTNKMKLFAQGLHQNALENLAFTGLVSLTMNQAGALKEENLDGNAPGYFQASFNAFNDLTFSMLNLGFIGVGATASYFGAKGALTEQIKTMDLQTKMKRLIQMKEETGVASGDALLLGPVSSYLGVKANIAKELADPVPNKALLNDLNHAFKVAKQTTEAEVLNFVDGDKQLHKILMDHIEQLAGSSADDWTGKFFSGSKKGTRADEADMLNNPEIQPGAIKYVDNQGAADFARAFYEDIGEPLTEETLQGLLRAKGFAITGGASKASTPGGGVFRGITNVDQARTLDDLEFTLRHEIGHTRTDIFNNELYQKTRWGVAYRTQAIVLSREARPGFWAEWDRIAAKLANKEDLTVWEKNRYEEATSAQELLADSYAMLSGKATHASSLEKAPNIYRLLVNNKAIQERFGNGNQLMRLKDGELFDAGKPLTAADHGPMEFDPEFGIITYGSRSIPVKDDFGIHLLDDIVSKKLSVQDINAQYAVSNKINLEGVTEINFDNLPKLTAAAAQGKTLSEINIIKDGEVINSDYWDIKSVLFDAKVDFGAKLNEALLAKHKALGFSNSAEGILSTGEAGLVIDSGEKFFQNITLHEFTKTQGYSFINTPHVSEADIPFWSMQKGQDPMEPYYIKLIADPRARSSTKGITNVLRGQVHSEARLKVARDTFDQMFYSFVGEKFAPRFISREAAPDWNPAHTVTADSSAASFTGSTNYEFFSGGAELQKIGKDVVDLKAHFDNLFTDFINPHAYAAAAKQEAVYEMAVIANTVRANPSSNPYTFVAPTFKEFMIGQNSLMEKFAKKFARINKSVFTKDQMESEMQKLLNSNLAKVKQSGMYSTFFDDNKIVDAIWSDSVKDRLTASLFHIPGEGEDLNFLITDLSKLSKNQHHVIANKENAEFMRALVTKNSELVNSKNAQDSFLGGGGKLRPDVVYFGGVNTERLPYHAMVEPQVTGIMADRGPGMIFAKNRADLDVKIARVKELYGKDVAVYLDSDIEHYKRLNDQFRSNDLFRDSRMDSSLKSQGIAYDVTPEPDVNIYNDIMTNHRRQWANHVTDMVETKYSDVTASLKAQSRQFDVLDSKTGERVEQRNAFSDAYKTMLGRRPESGQNFWTKFNTLSDGVVSHLWGELKEAMFHADRTGDNVLMDKYMTKYGFDSMYKDLGSLVLNNVSATAPFMAAATSKMNRILGTLMLRMDQTQPLVNVASMPISLVSVIGNLRHIMSSESFAELQKVMGVEVAEGVVIPHTHKLWMQGIANMAKDDGTLMAKYVKEGHVLSVMQEIQQSEGLFANLAKEKDPSTIMKTLNTVITGLSKPADWSEQFTRAVSANVADQIINITKMDARVQRSFTNTLVTQVHGNYVAAQRPGAFRGWTGQAIGLFQTYQFNMLQNLFRNFGERGNATVYKTLVAQGGIFGAQSVPGFQFMNQYIAEKSKQGNDFYSATNSIVGEKTANALLYGLASSATVPIVGDGISLYSRGDLTPRSPILVPSSLEDIPLISINLNFIKTLGDAAKKLGSGAPVFGTLVNALAHNGYNRPLQGIMQQIEGARTTKDGTTLATYQGMDLVNRIAKTIGTSSLSESVAVESYYRSATAEAARADTRNTLGSAFRQTIRSGGFDEKVYHDFMDSYVQDGGHTDDFNSWVVRNMNKSNQGQIEALRRANGTPRGKYLQSVMGGASEEQ